MKYLKTFENKEPEKKVEYYDNGNIKSRKQHREDGPAVEEWYENGQKSLESYVINNNFHREDGPAIIEWYENGQKIREAYYINDKRHREDGPAIQKWFENGKIEHEAYYIKGYIYYKKEDWINKLKEI